MKKLATIILVCVLTGSFMIGVFATDVSAKNQRPTPACVKLKLPACNLQDCRVYNIYFCPYGVLEIWTGEYCPATAPCWDPVEPQ